MQLRTLAASRRMGHHDWSPGSPSDAEQQRRDHCCGIFREIANDFRRSARQRAAPKAALKIRRILQIEPSSRYHWGMELYWMHHRGLSPAIPAFARVGSRIPDMKTWALPRLLRTPRRQNVRVAIKDPPRRDAFVCRTATKNSWAAAAGPPEARPPSSKTQTPWATWLPSIMQ